MALEDLVQRDPFGEKLITITAKDLNQTQISHFLQRMREYDRPVGKAFLCQFVNAEVVLDPRPPSSAYGRKGTSEDVDDEEPKVKKKKTWNPDEDESAIDAGDYEKPGRKKKGREEDDGTVGGEDDEKYAKRTKNREDGSTKKKKGREKRAYEQDQSEEEPISAYNVRCLL